MARNALWLDIQDQLVAERAGTREAGAAELRSDMNGDIAFGQHAQHIASTTIQPSSLVVTDDVMEGEAQQGGGEVEVVTLTADDVETLDRLYGPAPQLTWLERIARRWPLRVVQ